MRSISETVKQLIIINVIFFIGSQFLGDIGYDILALHYFENDKFLIGESVKFRSANICLKACQILLF